MRLTSYSDYSLRLLMYAALKGDGLVTIQEVSDAYGISRNHLMKVVYGLSLAGYVETVRGKNGGLRLARPPQEIVLGEVVRLTEPDMALVPCFDPARPSCVIAPACILRRALHEARSAFMAVLDSYTLADLVANGSDLSALLTRGPASSMAPVPAA